MPRLFAKPSEPTFALILDEARLFDCRYYQGLTVLQQHFPMGRKDEGILVEFPWYDAFQSTKRSVSDSVAYEKASVLFNLAAVCSQQSLASDLTTDGGLKAAARHFQVSVDSHSRRTLHAILPP